MNASSRRMPVVFVGHGNPMNALETNVYSEGWRSLSKRLPRPKMILSVSAHWYVDGTRVTAGPNPRTLHDFGGFPRKLFEVQYPAPGSPELVKRVQRLLDPVAVEADQGWGLDHGTWSVLVHMYPEADIPVVQLSIDETLTARQHFERAAPLAALRDEGVLILGSGNLVHNLHAYAWGRHPVEPYDWAREFESRMRAFLSQRDFEKVVGYEDQGREAALSAPTPEHFLPLLYVLAQGRPDDSILFPVEGFDGGSVSMLTVQIGS